MATTPVSPKVTASAIAAVIAGLVLANINLITPDLFAGLGKWSGLVYALTIAVITTAAGWAKSDPLRTAPADPGPAAPVAKPAEAPVVPAIVFPAAAVAAAEASPADTPPLP